MDREIYELRDKLMEKITEARKMGYVVDLGDPALFVSVSETDKIKAFNKKQKSKKHVTKPMEAKVPETVENFKEQ